MYSGEAFSNIIHAKKGVFAGLAAAPEFADGFQSKICHGSASGRVLARAGGGKQCLSRLLWAQR
ncbi:MAG: hypothetical protein LBS70_05695, partial [Candidatus Accumulibacter sp.]|nr:hypothetical protein [Accumulibacter sp.]